VTVLSRVPGVNVVIVRHYHEGRVYVVEFPDGTTVHRSRLTGMTVITVPWEGREVPVFDQPGELIVQLAEAGRYGLRLVSVGGATESSDSPP
jgi:hypothetical protein